MRPSLAGQPRRGLAGSFVGPGGECGRVSLSWITAGAIGGGGILVGALTLVGAIAPGAQLLAAPALFIVGAVIGAAHGCALAMLGRPEQVTRWAALRHAAVAAVAALPLLAAAWFVTMGISVTAALVTGFRLSFALVAAVGWALGLGVCGWAAWEGSKALRRAIQRWPDSRLGGVLLLVIGVVLSLTCVRMELRIWGTDVRLNWMGSVAVAVVITLWIGLPLVYVILHFAHGRLSARSAGGKART